MLSLHDICPFTPSARVISLDNMPLFLIKYKLSITIASEQLGHIVADKYSVELTRQSDTSIEYVSLSNIPISNVYIHCTFNNSISRSMIHIKLRGLLI